ncbi:hypothetical protein T11_3419, partial [Trichinella zimbabwensis]
LVICKISLQWNRPLKAVLPYALALRGGGSGLDLTLHVLINVAWRRLSIIADFTISYFFIFWLLICKISLQWNRPLKAVLAYALALRGGGSGVDLTLQ